MHELQTTVVMVTRERFSSAIEAIDTLYANTVMPFHLVYISTGTPDVIRDQIRERQQRYGFELIHTDRILTQNAARNLGGGQVKTPYFVVMDNDSLVSPGCLEALLACAEETGAAVVGPTVMIGAESAGMFHAGPMQASFQDTPRGRVFQKDMSCHNKPIDTLTLVRTQCTYVELHALLTRTQAWRDIGGFDESLLSLHEYSDFCLRMAEHGHRVWFEPTARVRYDPPGNLQWYDLPTFAMRWCDAWNRSSQDSFQSRWGIIGTRNIPADCFEGGEDIALRFARLHRRAAAVAMVDADAANAAPREFQAALRAALFVTVDHEWFGAGLSYEELLQEGFAEQSTLLPVQAPDSPMTLTTVDTTDNALSNDALFTLQAPDCTYRHWLACPTPSAELPPLRSAPIDWPLIAAHPGRVLAPGDTDRLLRSVPAHA